MAGATNYYRENSPRGYNASLEIAAAKYLYWGGAVLLLWSPSWLAQSLFWCRSVLSWLAPKQGCFLSKTSGIRSETESFSNYGQNPKLQVNGKLGKVLPRKYQKSTFISCSSSLRMEILWLRGFSLDWTASRATLTLSLWDPIISLIGFTFMFLYSPAGKLKSLTGFCSYNRPSRRDVALIEHHHGMMIENRYILW